MMRSVMIGLMWTACVAAHGHANNVRVIMPTDSLQSGEQLDSMRTDTLREVTVSGSTELPVEAIMNRTMPLKLPRRASISDMLEKAAPGITDYIFYPLAIKERRREKRRKRWMKALEHYDKIRTFDELLHEAYERQMLEDSLNRAR